MTDDFIMVPYDLIHDKDLGDKRVIVFSSILFSEWSGEDERDIVEYSDYSSCRNNTSILKQYREVVQLLIDKKHLSRVPGGMIYTKSLNGFGVIYHSDFQKIVEKRLSAKTQGKRINQAHLLLLLAHLRYFIFASEDAVYSNFLNEISSNLGLSVRSVSSCLKILRELNLIYSEELPRYQDGKGQWHSNVTLFTNPKEITMNNMIATKRDWHQSITEHKEHIITQTKERTKNN